MLYSYSWFENGELKWNNDICLGSYDNLNDISEDFYTILQTIEANGLIYYNYSTLGFLAVTNDLIHYTFLDIGVELGIIHETDNGYFSLNQHGVLMYSTDLCNWKAIASGLTIDVISLDFVYSIGNTVYLFGYETNLSVEFEPNTRTFTEDSRSYMSTDIGTTIEYEGESIMSLTQVESKDKTKYVTWNLTDELFTYIIDDEGIRLNQSTNENYLNFSLEGEIALGNSFEAFIDPNSLRTPENAYTGYIVGITENKVDVVYIPSSTNKRSEGKRMTWLKGIGPYYKPFAYSHNSYNLQPIVNTYDTMPKFMAESIKYLEAQENISNSLKLLSKAVANKDYETIEAYFKGDKPILFELVNNTLKEVSEEDIGTVTFFNNTEELKGFIQDKDLDVDYYIDYMDLLTLEENEGVSMFTLDFYEDYTRYMLVFGITVLNGDIVIDQAVGIEAHYDY